MAINFDFNDPKNQRILATIMVPVVIGYAFFHFMIKPKQQEVKSVEAQVVTLQRRVESIISTLERPEEMRNEKALLEKNFEELESLLPSEENVSLLLDQFTSIERDAKVYMVGFEATGAEEAEGQPYRSNRYRLTIESGFHQFSQFMSYVMSLPRILSISELNIQPNTTALVTGEEYEGLEDQPRTLTVECILTSYVFTGFSDTAEGDMQ